jgi:hypothetical protein
MSEASDSKRLKLRRLTPKEKAEWKLLDAQICDKCGHKLKKPEPKMYEDLDDPGLMFNGWVQRCSNPKCDEAIYW